MKKKKKSDTNASIPTADQQPAVWAVRKGRSPAPFFFWLQYSCLFSHMVPKHGVLTPWRKKGNEASCRETRGRLLVPYKSNNKLTTSAACGTHYEKLLPSCCTGGCIEIATSTCQHYWHLNTSADVFTFS